MRIVIDMQGAQTESRFRGIGRYTLSFAQAVVRNRGEHEIILALSGLFPDTIEPIRAAFDGLLAQENIRVWQAPGPVKECDSGNDSRRHVAELIREAFLASLYPDVVHITSLFEGYVDNAVSSIGRFDMRTPVSVVFYDLIPLLNPEQYLIPNPRYEAYYQRKVKYLHKAHCLLAISDFTRQEGLSNLNVKADQVINISSAIEPNFAPIVIDASGERSFNQQLGITRPFVLYSGGADERKNLPRLIQAYAKLPIALRQNHQLVLAGKMPQGNIENFKQIALAVGLNDAELVFTGYVSDEQLLMLYNLCSLYVFPSWHEGFGLPALEAMACGAVVIASNTSSLPEVIGTQDALFDPLDVDAIHDKINQALMDEPFRERLRNYGLQQAQKFSWDKVAQRALKSWQCLEAVDKRPQGVGTPETSRLINAVAPFLCEADEKSLAALSNCIAQNSSISMERQLLVDVSELCQRDSATGVQRVVRSYLFHLLNNPPRGFSVLPVYATQTESYRYATSFASLLLNQTHPDAIDQPIRWQRGDVFFALDMQHQIQLANAGLYDRMRQDGVVIKFLVHDLLPIQLEDYFKDSQAKDLHEQWLQMIAMQDEAICVSNATADAYRSWLSMNNRPSSDCFCINWVHSGGDLEGSKPSAGLPYDAQGILKTLESRPTFLTVSTLEPRKAQSQILDAVEKLWAEDHDVNLIFVGQQGWKIDALIERITRHVENNKRLFWLNGISDEYLELVYKASTCLIAASINEGFGLPLIEAARHGIPIIARDIPVFKEVAGQSAHYFSGETGEQLASALVEWLALDKEGLTLSSQGIKWSTWQQATENLKTFLLKSNYPRRQLLVDISELVQRDARTGIQRVVRSILKEWLQVPPDGFKVEPVYATEVGAYRYARDFSKNFTGKQINQQTDEPIDFSPGDVFFALDFQPRVQHAQASFYQHLRQQGVSVKFMAYDLLCILQPEHFPEGASHNFTKWLEVVGESDGAVCISQAVADELKIWMNEKEWARVRPFHINTNHLGADVDASVPMHGLPQSSDSVFSAIQQSPSFLMVGTLEPRKGHTQVLDAFELLWKNNTEANLVIVGKQGWMVDVLVDRLRQHGEIGKHLFWLEGISDEYLEKVYTASTALIAASYGEGFGLPLIEAAQHKLPIICRDIQVFREVASEHAFYFTASGPNDLANSIQEWLGLCTNGQHPKSDEMPWLTWQYSAKQLLEAIGIQSTQN